ncbi:E3 SUMO-protein ligase PIAS1 [Rhipicephalus microplus]|uniref:E3 SUMO-protein ligase PIAS1 n=1 Tax=Rhipicephalus microplus TaxID=6941 RepID=UPI003F6B09AA
MSWARPPVYFQRHPFYDVLATLLPATPIKCDGRLRHERSRFNQRIQFRFLARHINDIRASLTSNTGKDSELEVQVLVRLFTDEGSGELEDNYPANFSLKVNNRACAMPPSISVLAPGGTTLRVRPPVNIVSNCFLYPRVKNDLLLVWQPEADRQYFVGVFLVRRQSTVTALRKLQQKRVKRAGHTSAQTLELIKAPERASGGDDIEVTRVTASLTCPLGKVRMRVPCRGLGCRHIQCFDAHSYLQSNETRPTWMCPVCGGRAAFSSMVVDQLFVHILEEAPADCDSVVIHKDGFWYPSRKDDALRGEASSSARSCEHSSSFSSNEPNEWPNKRRKI